MARNPNASLIVFPPKCDKPVAVRSGSKTAIMLALMQQDNGCTLHELAVALTEHGGAPCSDSYARSWASPSYLANKGYGIKSRHDDDGQLRLFAYAGSTKIDNSRRDVDKAARAKRGGKRGKKAAA